MSVDKILDSACVPHGTVAHILGVVVACTDFACHVLFHDHVRIHLHLHVLLSYQIVVHILGLAADSVGRLDTVVAAAVAFVSCILGAGSHRRLR